MWLEDFQKGLIIFEIIKKNVKFCDCTCECACPFDYNGTHCLLFNENLSRRWNRCDKCVKIFGDKINE